MVRKPTKRSSPRKSSSARELRLALQLARARKDFDVQTCELERLRRQVAELAQTILNGKQYALDIGAQAERARQAFDAASREVTRLRAVLQDEATRARAFGKDAYADLLSRAARQAESE